MVNTTTADVAVGIGMSFSSIICILPNLIVMKTIYTNKELYHLNAYKFMLLMSVFDISQLVVHFITGFFNMFQSTGAYWFAKLLGTIVTPSYVSYAILLIILALNRFIQITSPKIDFRLFSRQGMMFWYCFVLAWFSLFALAQASPWSSIIYMPENWSWSYDSTKDGSKYVQLAAKIIEVGGIPIAGVFYFIVVVLLVFKRNQYKASNNFRTEIKIFVQAVIITTYCSILNCFWHNLFHLPDTKIANMVLNFMWIYNGAVNPVVYFIVNKSIRSNFVKIANKSVSRPILSLQLVLTMFNNCLV